MEDPRRERTTPAAPTGGEPDFVPLFNRRIAGLFLDAVIQSLPRPAEALRLLQLRGAQRRAARLRSANRAQGLHVPPLVIASITRRCNLHCAGCYSRAFTSTPEPELRFEEWRRILAEASDLGTSIAMIAGGEPFARPDLLQLTRDFPEMVFPVFTNGLLIDEAVIGELRRQRHVIPILSLEGRAVDTDDRRGRGVHDRVIGTAALLKRKGLFFGTSVTLTRLNFESAVSPETVDDLRRAGSRLVVYVEYTPIEAGTEDLTLTAEQKARVSRLSGELSGRRRPLVIAFPGDETQYGGCLAAGRGFLHISPEGRLEACPFAPFSDTGLRRVSLREALASPLLRILRENHALLTEDSGGCALWNRKEWVRSLLDRPRPAPPFRPEHPAVEIKA